MSLGKVWNARLSVSESTSTLLDKGELEGLQTVGSWSKHDGDKRDQKNDRFKLAKQQLNSEFFTFYWLLSLNVMFVCLLSLKWEQWRNSERNCKLVTLMSFACNAICTSITLFVRGCCCTTMAWNVSRFLGEVNSRPQFSFHFLNLKTSPLEFISRKIAIISKNWTRWNKGDVVVHTFSHVGIVQNITCSKLWPA